MSQLVDDIVGTINDFITEISTFIDYDLETTATAEMVTRLEEYDANLYPPLNAWWNDGTNDPNTSTLPALRAMTGQLSLAKVDQTRQIGSFLDARLLNERVREKQMSQADASRRYGAAETLSACQMATLGETQTRAYHMSRALSRALTLEDTKRRNNYLETPPRVAARDGLLVRSAHAAPPPEELRGQQINQVWQDYESRYCDPSTGDQGCGAPGAQAGKNTDLPGYLWGDSQNINMGDAAQAKSVNDALRTMISPFTPEPVPATVIDTAQGQEEIMARRSRDARLNTIYTAMSQMISERVGPGSGDTTEIRRAAGLTVPTENLGASYSEIRDTMSKGRVFNAQYITRLVNEPSATGREQTAASAIQSQLMGDIQRRYEEMIVLEAAAYGDELDRELMPRADSPFLEGDLSIAPVPGVPIPSPPPPGAPPSPPGGPVGPPPAPGTPPAISDTNPCTDAGLGTDKQIPRFGNAVEYIVLHHTATTNLCSTLFDLSGPEGQGRNLSIHYTVDYDGTVYQIVPDDMAARHAGKTEDIYWDGEKENFSKKSIGIEIMNNGVGEAFPPIQTAAIRDLVASLMSSHGVPAMNVLGHMDVNLPPNKFDPHPNFQWQMLADAGVAIMPEDWDVRLPGDDGAVTEGEIDPLLLRMGYNPEAEYSRRVQAFNLHYDPDRYNNRGMFTADAKTLRLLQDLLAQTGK